MKRQFWLLLAVPVLALGCSGSQSASSGGKDGGGREEGAPDLAPGDSSTDASPPPVDNVAQLVVNQGLAGSESADVPYVSVTICVPGTTTCQTIDDVILDTGSSGLRIMAAALSGSVALPQQSSMTGGALVECSQFGSGYTWGSVRDADVKIGGELAAKIPLQLIGDPQFATVPPECSSAGPALNSPEGLGANGLLGINQIIPDCGQYCSPPHPLPGGYYSCSGSSCAVTGVAIADQVSNPIASFGKDNNGAVVTFPTIATAGATELSGQLIFGIGTESNNALGTAKVITVDSYGNFTTVFNGQSLPMSFIDSGTNLLSFNDTSIPDCPSQLNFLFCPSSTLSLMAENEGKNGATSSVSFTVANADDLFGHLSYTAFDDLAGSGEEGSFDWGFPFFIGKSVYVALDGATTPGGAGPYFAY
jgi:hypothetical protein